ncbi:hypothetical protein GCM10017744_032540 [Streptomyces antimycoticus]
MSARPHSETASYVADDPEIALKYAIQHIRGDDRVQIVEGVIEQSSPTWDHENAAGVIREQIGPVMRKLAGHLRTLMSGRRPRGGRRTGMALATERNPPDGRHSFAPSGRVRISYVR